MAKLNQIVAVVNGKKTECQKALTEVHRKSMASDLFTGISRTYQPLSEESEVMPNEVKNVVYNTDQALKDAEEILTELFDVVATQDYNNGRAVADVVVNGVVVLEDVPVTYLLFLEKQLNDVHKFVSSLPVLDVAETWNKDQNKECYVSNSYETLRNKKVLRHKVLYEATKEHPANIEKWTEDVPVGKYINTKMSGAMPLTEKKSLLGRVKELQDAVKFAREESNSIDVDQIRVGEKVFKYLLGK
jgi:hypothetical protein